MKTSCKRILAFFLWCSLLVVMLSSLSGCTGIKHEEAKEIMVKFFDALQEKNYEKAESYFHPWAFSEGVVQKGELEQIMETAKQDGIDFTSGYEIVRYTSISFRASIGASTYNCTAEMKTGNTSFTVEMAFYRDNSAIGITAFYMQKNQENQAPGQTI